MCSRAWLLQFPHPGMGELLVRTGISLILTLCSAGIVAAQPTTTDDDLPSAEMLEFLGDLEPVDEATWQLLEHHALKDVAANKEVPSE